MGRLGFSFALPFIGLGRTENLMSSVTFNRDRQATWHGLRFLKSDATAREVHYLKQGAPEREVRLIVVNEGMPEMRDDCIEPLDFGIDRHGDGGAKHKLLVIDVTPEQWERIRRNQIPLPPGWSVDGSTTFTRRPS